MSAIYSEEKMHLHIRTKNYIMEVRNLRKSKINRVYKDRLFRMAFRGKKDLLESYNAINGSHAQY